VARAPDSPIRLILVEDDRVLAHELSALLRRADDLKLVGLFDTPDQAEKAILGDPVDVVVTDIQLPGRSGVELIRACKPKVPDTQFLVLTMFDDDDLVFTALRAGASAYILKRNLDGQLAELIRELDAGGSPMSSSIARKLVKVFQGRNDEGTDPLAPREKELLDLLARGRSYKECASEMSIKIDTVRTHIRRLYGKLHARNRHEAVTKARGFLGFRR